jgi:hypothetical protein
MLWRGIFVYMYVRISVCVCVYAVLPSCACVWGWVDFLFNSELFVHHVTWHIVCMYTHMNRCTCMIIIYSDVCKSLKCGRNLNRYDFMHMHDEYMCVRSIRMCVYLTSTNNAMQVHASWISSNTLMAALVQYFYLSVHSLIDSVYDCCCILARVSPHVRFCVIACVRVCTCNSVCACLYVYAIGGYGCTYTQCV